ncbi:hypothetical protein Tco_1250405, partial [Tanacetum coccineum]
MVVEWFWWMSRNGLITTWDRDAFSLARVIEARLDDQAATVVGTSAKTLGNNGGDDSKSLGPVTPTEEVVGNGHSSTLMDNEGNHNFVQLNMGERMRLQAMVTGRPYQRVEGSPKETMWEWMLDSKLTYSPYHLEGKVIFEGVGNVTPWAADGGRRKRVKCYIHGSRRRKRKMVIGRGNRIPDSTRISYLSASCPLVLKRSLDHYDHGSIEQKFSELRFLEKVDPGKVIMEYLVNISKRHAFWSLNEDVLKINDSDYQYTVSIKEDTAYPCLPSPKTTKETSLIR